jgi:hypothetical protein
MRQWIALTSGVLLGWALALELLSHPDSAVAARILPPFGKLGFIIGNPHQGSEPVTVVAIFLAFGIAGLAVSMLAVFLERRRFRH